MVTRRPHFISALISATEDIDADRSFSTALVSNSTIQSWTARQWVVVSPDWLDDAVITDAGLAAVARWSV